MLLNLTSVHATAKDCSIRVNPELIARMREAYSGEESQAAVYRFYSEEFGSHADGVYIDLGMPIITLATAWDIFQLVVKEHKALPAYK